MANVLTEEPQQDGRQNLRADIMGLTLDHLAQGQSNRDIARTLIIGEQTVKTHVAHILGKLGLSSRTQAALHAVRIGLASPDSPNP